MLIKYSNDHKIEWATSIPEHTSYRLDNIKQTNDGKFMVKAFKEGTQGESNANVLIKYKPVNTEEKYQLEWKKEINGEILVIDNDGAYTVERDINIAKYSANGEMQWQKEIYVGIDNCKEIENNTYIGIDANKGIVKYNNNNGECEWKTVINGRFRIDDIVPLKSGKYIGTMYNNTTGYWKIEENFELAPGQSLLFKVEEKDLGNPTIVKGEKIINSISNRFMEIDKISLTSDGGYIVGGTFSSREIKVGENTFINHSEGITDVILVKYDNKKQIEWSTPIGSRRFRNNKIIRTNR